MKVLNKNTDYAIRSALELAQAPDGVFVSASQLAKAQGIPLPFLRGILKKLASAGIIEAREGARGGVRLVKKPGHINLADLVTLFQGPIEFSTCRHKGASCPNRRVCPLRRRLLSISDKVAEDFKKITLDRLLAEAAAG